MLFTTAAPWAPFAALIFNLVEMRLDSKHLLFDCQRPVPSSSPGFGKWYDVFCAIVAIGIMTNVALVVFVIDHIPISRAGERVWNFVILQYVIYSVAIAILLSIPTTSEVVQIQLARTSTWVTRIFQREIVLDEDTLFDATLLPDIEDLEHPQNKFIANRGGLTTRELDMYKKPGMSAKKDLRSGLSDLEKYRKPSRHRSESCHYPCRCISGSIVVFFPRRWFY